MQKLGFYPKINCNNPVHIHCVSVGEFNACKILIDKLLQQHYQVLVTNTTKTGFDACKTHYGNKVHRLFFPFDTHFAISKFLTLTSPAISLMFETEIWPNYAKNCQQRNITLGLINARLSKKSFEKYYKYQNFSKKVLDTFTFIATQNEESSAYFKQLTSTNITTFSSVKFDFQPHLNKNKINQILAATQHKKFVVCSSTHAGEEEQIIKAYLRNKIQQLLVIIPRHPERFNEVEKLLIKHSINYQKQSQFRQDNCDVLLVDKMGWLLEYYSLCDIAFIGGSLSPKLGGHNILEAIAFNKLTITGKNTLNFKAIIAELLQRVAIIEVRDANEVMQIARNYEMHPERYQEITKNAHAFFKQQTGVSENIITLIKSYL